MLQDWGSRFHQLPLFLVLGDLFTNVSLCSLTKFIPNNVWLGKTNKQNKINYQTYVYIYVDWQERGEESSVFSLALLLKILPRKMGKCSSMFIEDSIVVTYREAQFEQWNTRIYEKKHQKLGTLTEWYLGFLWRTKQYLFICISCVIKTKPRRTCREMSYSENSIIWKSF